MANLITQGLGESGHEERIYPDTEPPYVVLARSIDAHAVEIFFSRAAVMVDALNVANYSIDNGLTVVAVTRMTPVQYRLTTSTQTPNLEYKVTAINIRSDVGD